jgi:hypothetical protein
MEQFFGEEEAAELQTGARVGCGELQRSRSVLPGTGLLLVSVRATPPAVDQPVSLL